MKRFSEQLHTKAKTVKLQAAEQRELRLRVVSYMEYHPLPAASQGVVKNKKQSTGLFGYNIVQIPFSLVLKWSAATAAFFLVVIPILAEKSVPGDNLYAVKVRFSEEVRSTLTLTPYAKVEWETERINRRVAEARLLATEGKLTNEVEAEIAAAVKEHATMVQQEIDVLRASDADQATLASIELTTTLELQSASLQEERSTTLALAMDDVAAANPAQLVVDVINESLAANESQMEAADVPAYDKTMARVEVNTTRAYELLQSLALPAEDTLRIDLTRRLDDVYRSIETAKAVRQDNETLAREQLIAVLQRIQKLLVYMSDIDANRDIALESIVPIILTPDEQKQELTTVLSDISRKQEVLRTVMPQLTLAVSEKVAYAMQIVESKQMAIASSSDVATSLTDAQESSVVLDDALRLVQASGVSIVAAPVDIDAVDTTNASSSEAVGGDPELTPELPGIQE